MANARYQEDIRAHVWAENQHQVWGRDRASLQTPACLSRALLDGTGLEMALPGACASVRKDYPRPQTE